MVLILAITLWKFESPLGFQLPKWEFTWECEGSFPHTLLHCQKHEMWLPGLILAYTLASPCLGREPKVRVVTMKVFQKNNYSYEARLLGNEQQLCWRLLYYAQTRFESHLNICPNIHKFGSHDLKHVWIVANYLWLFQEQVMLLWFLSNTYR